MELLEPAILAGIEPFSSDGEDAPSDAVHAWRRELRAADAVLFATPEYNGSFPGHLKNALDWASRSDSDTAGLAGSALYGRDVAVVSASTGQFGAVWAQDALRTVLGRQGARVVDGPKVAVPRAAEAFANDDSLSDSGQATRLRELIGQLLAATEAIAAG